MSKRDFFLAAYDVSDRGRLRAALDLVRGYATGGQKSVHEIFLTPAERGALLCDMSLILEHGEDRFLLLKLDLRARCHALGVATAPEDGSYFYVG
ncbi:MAG: CRISPR-associated endonuclease Cas2 [Burkholderiales bacterium]|nr:CRISPR-associated endonuclease Cas2 [Burkholderiales bacterium]